MSKLTGEFDASEIISSLDLTSSKIKEGLGQGVEDAAEILRADSLLEVPFRDGQLAKSCVVSADRSKLEAAVSYDTVYAVYQHERMDLKHLNGRKAKYLEDPMNNEGTRGKMLAAIRAAVSL